MQKIPTRFKGHDLQIIWLNGDESSSMNFVLFCRASQCGWLSGRARTDVALVAVEEAVPDSDVGPCGGIA